MSQAGEEEGDEDDECFHESLDRLLSSSNTSCSCSTSTSEPEEDHDPNLPDYDEPAPVRNYDVWISHPTSVEERRFLLLRQMGLNGDPSILRHRSSLSLSSNHLNLLSEKSYIFKHSNSGDCVNYDNGIRISGIIRSKSDGDCNSCETSDVKNSVAGIRGITVKSDSASFLQNYSHTERSSSGHESPGSSTLSPNKPPKGKLKMDCTRNRSCSSLLSVLGNGVGEGVECNGAADINAMCMIKNLDNGKKFVVNKVREDGMWEKIKEVGTGRQLTMEGFSSEMCVGTSPIVQELMRRQIFEDGNREGLDPNADGSYGSASKSKKKGNWLRSMKNAANSVVGHKEKRCSDEKDSLSEKGGRRSSSATDDSQDVSFHGPEKIRVRQYGKSVKELSALYKTQELQAHKGSIWTIKFSLDGKYLASAGEDCVILVWGIVETERKGDFSFDKPEDGNLNILFVHKGSPEPLSPSPNLDDHWETKKRGRSSVGRKFGSLKQILVPETVFALSEKPICSLRGHLNDVLDLSWSKSQQLLSSSMDKTVRLWDLSSKSCLKIFSHSDIVTCIQFNPVDDRYFISGSLDAKVRIWSIPNRQVVDWSDLHEMVTAACYTPDGKGALVGSYKGSCRLYNTSENKMQQKNQINLQNQKKKSHQKKITGFQFAPGSTSEVFITTADSRIRVLEGVDVVRKFKGPFLGGQFNSTVCRNFLKETSRIQALACDLFLMVAFTQSSQWYIFSKILETFCRQSLNETSTGFRNTNSQISASLTSNGEYVISASEDSYVYVWRHDGDSRPNRSKGVTETRSYEFFHCQNVSVAIPWPGMPDTWEIHDSCAGMQNSAIDHFEMSRANHPTTPVEETNGRESSPLASGCSGNSPLDGTLSSVMNSSLSDRIPVTWVEEKPSSASKSHSPHVSGDFSTGFTQSMSAWGMVIVTAGLGGEIKTFQNFGLPAGHK